VQIKLVPVAEPFNAYTNTLRDTFKKAGLRVEVDGSDNSFSKKIRNAEIEKIPYILIV